MLDPAVERWKRYLRRDPTRWLLETNDPSILLSVQVDIAHRPLDSVAVVETRDRVLYSDSVQAILAAQDELGFWSDAGSIAHPYYRATIWNLCLLKELGVSPRLRRARNATEFILQNFFNDDGTFRGLDPLESAYLVDALGYFNSEDSRVECAANALASAKTEPGTQAAILWALRAWRIRAHIAPRLDALLEQLLEKASAGEPSGAYCFPQFATGDPLFVLRVLADYGRVSDPRAQPLINAFVSKQDEQSRWTLERDFNAQLVTPFETAGSPSRWLTLNALRVITELVAG